MAVAAIPVAEALGAGIGALGGWTMLEAGGAEAAALTAGAAGIGAKDILAGIKIAKEVLPIAKAGVDLASWGGHKIANHFMSGHAKLPSGQPPEGSQVSHRGPHSLGMGIPTHTSTVINNHHYYGSQGAQASPFI